MQGTVSVTAKPKVFITDFVTDDLHIEREVLGSLADLAALGAKSERELWGKVEAAFALIIYHAVELREPTITRLNQCRVIVRAGVGFDNVDIQFARSRGIPVVNIPDYGSEEVADTALAMTLALTRGVHLMNSQLRAAAGPWSYKLAVPVFRLRGRVFGVIGLGRIGTAAALRAKALGMEVLFYDPYKPDGYDKALGVHRAESLEELLPESFVLSIHCPLTEETRHMIDRRAIGLLPRGAYLVNTARGPIVDQGALLEGLEQGHLAGAGLDVLEEEPPRDDDPLIRAWRDPGHPAHHRLILNPHAAFYCEEGFHEMRRKTAEACRRAILGQPLRNVVN